MMFSAISVTTQPSLSVVKAESFPIISDEAQHLIDSTTTFLNLSKESNLCFGGLFATHELHASVWGGTNDVTTSWSADAQAYKFNMVSAADCMYVYLNQNYANSKVVRYPAKIKILYYQDTKSTYPGLNVYYGDTANWSSHFKTLATTKGDWNILEIDASDVSLIELFRIGYCDGAGDLYIKAVSIETIPSEVTLGVQKGTYTVEGTDTVATAVRFVAKINYVKEEDLANYSEIAFSVKVGTVEKEYLSTSVYSTLAEFSGNGELNEDGTYYSAITFIGVPNDASFIVSVVVKGVEGIDDLVTESFNYTVSTNTFVKA